MYSCERRSPPRSRRSFWIFLVPPNSNKLKANWSALLSFTLYCGLLGNVVSELISLFYRFGDNFKQSYKLYNNFNYFPFETDILKPSFRLQIETRKEKRTEVQWITLCLSGYINTISQHMTLSMVTVQTSIRQSIITILYFVLLIIEYCEYLRISKLFSNSKSLRDVNGEQTDVLQLVYVVSTRSWSQISWHRSNTAQLLLRRVRSSTAK